ncbi:MAG: hypothetical protein KBB86_01115 [Candidatus Pacebacteria bacterium]|nr:hypothetical protein [Candidatus Paceibacterota bacterium]
MHLSEVKQLILQDEIRTPILDDEKFNDEEHLIEPFPQTSESERHLISETLFKALNPIFKNVNLDGLVLPL